jgi:hypothetical protein
MSLLNNLKSSKSKSAGNKKSYTLPEIVGILYLINALQGQKDWKHILSEKTGRSKHSLQYKFFEGQVAFTDPKTGEVKETIRSVAKYNTIEELFADHSVQWSQELEDSYIENYLKQLNGEVVAVDLNDVEVAS